VGIFLPPEVLNQGGAAARTAPQGPLKGTLKNQGACAVQGCTAIFMHLQCMNMEQSGNRIFAFATRKIPRKGFFEVPRSVNQPQRGG
jgi:hypothetical protein